ncbi:MAG TPA: hypothetical protein VF558_01710 [Rubrobacteraceae bacterium]|jgi:hypothetical protein
MSAVPQECVLRTSPRYAWNFPYLQSLRSRDIASIEGPHEGLIAKDAKGQEMLAGPGVEVVGMSTYLYST